MLSRSESASSVPAVPEQSLRGRHRTGRVLPIGNPSLRDLGGGIFIFRLVSGFLCSECRLSSSAEAPLEAVAKGETKGV